LQQARKLFDYYERYECLPRMHDEKKGSDKWHVFYRIYLLREALSIWDMEKNMQWGECVAEERRKNIVKLFEEMDECMKTVNEPSMLKFTAYRTEYDLNTIIGVISSAVIAAAPNHEPAAAHAEARARAVESTAHAAAHRGEPVPRRTVDVGGGGARVVHKDGPSKGGTAGSSTSRKSDMHEHLAEMGRLSEMMSAGCVY
jgi:hypothetical protein